MEELRKGEIRTLQRQRRFDRIDEILTEEPSLTESTDPSLQLVLATVEAARGNRAAVAAFLDRLDDVRFQERDDISDLALALIAVGRLGEARKLLDDLTQRNLADGYVYARRGTVRLLSGEHEGAASDFHAALDQLPDHPDVLMNLGGVRLRQDRLYDALECYDRAIQLRPDFEKAHRLRRQVQVALGRGPDLLAELESAVSQEPENVERYRSLAHVQAQLDRHQEAEETLRTALAKFPDARGCFVQLVNVLMARRKWWQAGRLLFDWHEWDPQDLEIRVLLDKARLEMNFLSAVDQDLEHWTEDQKASPNYDLLRARLLGERQKAQEAVAILQDLVDRYPGHMEARQHLLLGLRQLGLNDEARAHQRVLAQISPGAAIHEIAERAETPGNTDIALLRELKEKPTLSREQRVQAGFSLAHLLDRRQEYQAAFAALEEANKEQRHVLDYDWRQHRQRVAATLATFSQETADEIGGMGHPSERPIFVLGMPRSGTTLVEQILASHPNVFGAGELGIVPRLTQLMPKVLGKPIPYPDAIRHLTSNDILDAGRYYLERVEKIAGDAPRVVDKLPHNFDHIGLILAMLPNAKIVHLKRDPRDVAISNYFQNFAAKHGLMGYAFDLADIGHMINDHDRIMDHWYNLYGQRIYQVTYERLVADPEKHVPDLLGFCGLEWDERVMRFYETQRPVKTASVTQVRKGFYTTSSEKWRRYESYLGPLDDVLSQGFQPVSAPAPSDQSEPEKSAGSGENGSSIARPSC